MTSDHHKNDNIQPSISLAPGTAVSHYRIIDKIGSGGMGEVYLAMDDRLNREAALKFLSLDLCGEEDFRKRFTREAQAAAKLSHPNIVTVYEVDEMRGRPFYSMEYLEGQTLAQWSSSRILSVETIVDAGIQLCAALIAAHEQGITHRDLKPSNIIVSSSNEMQVLDFGLAIIGDPTTGHDYEETVTKLTSLGGAAGTLPYMAPEQLTGQEVGPLVDVFALGVILYELSCGERPFGGKSGTEVATSILRDAPPLVSKKRRDAPYDLARIISRCLHKDPHRRFQSAKDVRNELLELRELMEQSDAYVDIDRAAMTGKPSLIEAEFNLTADLVRRMAYKSPQMIGSSMSYLDNGVASNVLAIFLHGLGLDQRQFSDLLRMFPHRGIAPTLYGYDVHADQRLPLSLEDHSVLLRSLFAHLQGYFKPRYVVLCGHSTGADHILHLIQSSEGVGIGVDGLLSFGCNTNLRSCLLSSKLSALTSAREDDIIEAIREFGHTVGSLKDYLTVCEYMVTGFQKFENDIESLRQLAIGLVRPFEDRGWDQFPLWYRAAVERVPHIRFIFSRYEFEALDEILRRHLESNVLGDGFKEETIVRENVSHLDLSDPELMLKHTQAIIERIVS